DKTQLFQILQSGIDRAGAGRIFATRALFQRFDDFIAMFGSIAERIEQHRAHFAAPCPSAPPFGASPLLRPIMPGPMLGTVVFIGMMILHCYLTTKQHINDISLYYKIHAYYLFVNANKYEPMGRGDGA